MEKMLKIFEKNIFSEPNYYRKTAAVPICLI